MTVYYPHIYIRINAIAEIIDPKLNDTIDVIIRSGPFRLIA